MLGAASTISKAARHARLRPVLLHQSLLEVCLTYSSNVFTGERHEIEWLCNITAE